jgi:bacteriocin-like protein
VSTTRESGGPHPADAPVDTPIEGELTEEELESVVGGCGHRRHHHRHLPINRTLD